MHWSIIQKVQIPNRFQAQKRLKKLCISRNLRKLGDKPRIQIAGISSGESYGSIVKAVPRHLEIITDGQNKI